MLAGEPAHRQRQEQLPEPNRADRRAISEIEIWSAANLLIERHGAGAASEATRRAGHMLDCGDSAEWQIWARIRPAVEAALQAPRWASRFECEISSHGAGAH